MKLIDSHCHLNFPDLVNNLDNIFNRMLKIMLFMLYVFQLI